MDRNLLQKHSHNFSSQHNNTENLYEIATTFLDDLAQTSDLEIFSKISKEINISVNNFSDVKTKLPDAIHCYESQDSFFVYDDKFLMLLSEVRLGTCLSDIINETSRSDKTQKHETTLTTLEYDLIQIYMTMITTAWVSTCRKWNIKIDHKGMNPSLLCKNSEDMKFYPDDHETIIITFQFKEIHHAITIITTSRTFATLFDVQHSHEPKITFQSSAWRDHICNHMSALKIPVEMVLKQESVTLEWVQSLKTGMIIKLPDNALSTLQATLTLSSDRFSLFQGYLGCIDQHKAVRSSSDIDRNILADLSTLGIK